MITHFEWTTLILSAIGILLIPLIRIAWLAMTRWIGTENQLKTLVKDVGTLVENQDKVHSEIYRQMQLDRDATNKRLRYLEEYFMSHGMRK
jgi:hypothetical protein